MICAFLGFSMSSSTSVQLCCFQKTQINFKQHSKCRLYVSFLEYYETFAKGECQAKYRECQTEKKNLTGKQQERIKKHMSVRKWCPEEET